MSGAEAKFSSSNGEEKVDIETPREDRVGLTKEELMKFATDPFWVALRRGLFLAFWLIWISMLVGAVYIIYVTPKCKASKMSWAQQSPMYNIKFDSDFSSKPNATGHLLGVEEKLPYLKDVLSITTIILDDATKPDLTLKEAVGTEKDLKKLTSKAKVIVRLPIDQQKTESLIEDAVKFYQNAGVSGFILDNFVPSNLNLVNKIKSLMSTVDQPFVAVSAGPTEDVIPDSICNQTSMVLNYDMLKNNQIYIPKELTSILEDSRWNAESTTCLPNHVLSAPGNSVKLERFGGSMCRLHAYILFNMLSPATPIWNYGDEFGINDLGQNSPKNDWGELERLKEQSDTLKLFQEAASFRKKSISTVVQGDTSINVLKNDVVAMSRIKQGFPGFVVVSNFKSTPETIELTQYLSHLIPETGEIVIQRSKVSDPPRAEKKVNIRQLELRGEETLVVVFIPEKPSSDAH